MRHPIDTELPPEIVAACIDLLDVVVRWVFAQNEGKFLTTSCINNELAFEVFLNLHWSKNCMPGILLHRIFVCM